MLRVYYSNRTEELVQALVAETAARREGPLDPAVLVASNRQLQDYLELRLAGLTGVSVRLEAPSLEALLAGASGRRPLEDRYLGAILGALFDDALLARPELETVRRHLFGSSDRDGADRRRVRLARKLAALFTDYELHRPEILECWRAGLLVGDEDASPIEPWQRYLWREVEGRLESDGAPSELPRAVHLFGFTRIGRGQALELGRLAARADVLVYWPNPCQEIWEAIAQPLPASVRRYERRGSDLGPGEVYSLSNPFRLSNPGESTPLRLWGRPARENLRLLNALTGCELVSRVRAPEGRTVLKQLQRDVALRKPEREAPPKELPAGDDSIVFMECPSVRREIEAIAASIWELLAADEGRSREEGGGRLRFSDIAVLLAPSPPERYRSLVATVFRDTHDIPFRFVGLSPDGETTPNVLDLVEALVDLPLSDLTRKDLLRVLAHPVMLAATSGSDPLRWTALVESLGRGASDAARWEQGLARLALASFSSGEVSLAAEDTESAGAFGLLLRSLLADVRRARRLHMTLPAWMDFLGAYVSGYVVPTDEEDERTFGACLRAIARFAELDAGATKVSYRIARELLAAELRKLELDRVGALDGVVVSSLSRLRSVPFEVSFVAGLGEADFPRKDATDPMNLGSVHRRAGDVGAKDEDRSSFFDRLSSTRERLVLSYVARDEITGEARRPSSVVRELQRTLRRGYLGDALRIERWPSERYEDPRTFRASPSARRERGARRLGDHLRSLLGSHPAPPSGLSGELPGAVAAALGVVPPLPPRETPPRRFQRVVPLSALRRFLECPLQGSAAFHLEIAGEPHGSEGAGSRDTLLAEAFRLGATAKTYDETTERLGLVESPMRGWHLEALETWRELLEEADGVTPGALETSGKPERLVLGVGGARVVLERGDGLVHLAPRAALRLVSLPPERFDPERESLRGFLDHVFLSAAEADGGGYHLRVLNAHPSTRGTMHAFRFGPVEPETAKRYLSSLAGELLEGAHAYRLPCEAVLGSPSERPIGLTSSARGPIPHPEDHPVLPEDEAQAVRERRFGLYDGSLLREEAS